MKYSEVFAQRIFCFELFAAVWAAESYFCHVFHNAADTCVVFISDLCLEVGFPEIFQTPNLFLRHLSISFRCFEFQTQSVVGLVCVRNYKVGLSCCVALAPGLDAFVARSLQFPKPCDEQGVWIMFANEIHNFLMQRRLVLQTERLMQLGSV